MTLATDSRSRSAFSLDHRRGEPFLATQESDLVGQASGARMPRVWRYSVGGFTAAAFAFAITSKPSETLHAVDFSAIGEALGARDHGRALAPHFLDAYEEMQDFRSLEDGWDGIGSNAPSARAVDSAIAFLKCLPQGIAPPEASVSADGTVDWFWRTQDGMVTVNFSSSGRMAYYGRVAGSVARGTQKFDGSVPDDLLGVIKLI